MALPNHSLRTVRLARNPHLYPSLDVHPILDIHRVPAALIWRRRTTIIRIDRLTVSVTDIKRVEELTGAHAP